MSVPNPPHPDPGGRWETIKYALDSNARTIRLCCIWTVIVGAPSLAATATGLLPHLLSKL